MANETFKKYDIHPTGVLKHSISDNVADIILKLDRQGRIMFAPTALQLITGYNEQELSGRFLRELLHDEDIIITQLTLESVLKRPATPVLAEFKIKHKEGKIVWMEGTAVNMLNVQGIELIVLNVHDVTFRKQADREIVASEIKFRSLIENSHGGITLMSPEHKLVYLSSTVSRVLGYAPEELLQTDPRLLSHPEDLEPVGKIIGDLYPRFGETATAEYRMRHKNGEWRWLKSNITNLLHQEHIRAFVFNYEDITERKKTEALIMQSERMMADAQKIAHFGSWEIDIADGTFGELCWSDEVFRIFGYEPASIAITIEKFYESVYPEDRDLVQATIDKAFKENSHYSVDHRITWPNGLIRWVHEDAQFIAEETSGKFYKVVGTVQDITERKNAEERLLKSEANLKAIFDNTAIGYVMLDENLRVVTFNPEATRWINSVYKEPLYPGYFFVEHMKDATEAARLRVILKKALEGENTTFDYHAVPGEAGEMWYTIRVNPIIGPNKKVQGICVSLSNITIRKQTEIEREKITADLIQRNKELEQFTYVISHNLRAPLTNIMGLSQLLQEDNQPDEERKIFASQLAISIEKMDGIIKDLNYVLQVKKEISEVKQMVQFSILINDIKLSIDNIIAEERVQIITDFTEVNELITIKSYLYSIFYNLITNSIKYRKQGVAPVITITSKAGAKNVEIIFSDNGLGIDLKKKGKDVFGLYKRFHYHIEGKGMGLFMTKTQIETMGGFINIESETNKGTKFTITLPVS